MFDIFTLHNDNNRNGEKFLFHYLRVIVKVILSKLSDQHYNSHVPLLVKYCILL